MKYFLVALIFIPLVAVAGWDYALELALLTAMMLGALRILDLLDAGPASGQETE